MTNVFTHVTGEKKNNKTVLRETPALLFVAKYNLLFLFSFISLSIKNQKDEPFDIFNILTSFSCFKSEPGLSDA